MEYTPTPLTRFSFHDQSIVRLTQGTLRAVGTPLCKSTILGYESPDDLRAYALTPMYTRDSAALG